MNHPARQRTIAPLHLVLLLTLLCATPLHAQGTATSTINIPDDGWRLWPDTQAKWQDDDLFLPDEVDLKKLPINQPTGGWSALGDTAGIPVTLPSTVEQHYWGKFGFRPYKADEYVYATTDSEVKNGNYLGVSWWYRDIDVPASFAEKLVLLHIRGARQRAEVYVNQKLVGYNFMEETSFDCDLTSAIKPGQKNQIAIRITNPGGRLDWLDTLTMNWGKFRFQKSHGFGGLDRGITLSAHDPVYINDLWVLNTPQERTVTAHALLRNQTHDVEDGTVNFSIIDPATGQSVATASATANVPVHGTVEVQSPVTYADAQLWTTDAPHLYRMHAQWQGGDKAGGKTTDDSEKQFGFRWFEPRGIGSEAGLYLNGSRVRLYTSISWGFWGINGLWPTHELAEKEVTDAKLIGLNCLNFHRNIGKEEVLALQDELGLLRYMEPGGGVTALGSAAHSGPHTPKAVDSSGTGGDANDFTEKYEDEKLFRMIRQFRSHPSLVIYVIQNETDIDLSKPRIFNLIRKMHALDPSRVIAAKSGIEPTHQVWMAPYDDTVHYDDGTGFSGWRDQHTVGGPGVWQDNMYKDPEHFTHRTDGQKEIVDWGEMLGSATPDNHATLIQQIQSHGGESYDLADHKEIDAAYNAFLDRWHFRLAYPTSEALYHDIDNKCYQFWGHVIETERLSEGNDILTISGWESTAIENHSGLVDNMRNIKGDVALMRPKFAALLPVPEPRGTVFKPGDAPLVDLYLINETNQPTPGHLHLKITDPSGKQTDLAQFDVPAYQPNHFVYPIKQAYTLPPQTQEGEYTLTLALDGDHPAENSNTIRIVNPDRSDLSPLKIALIGEPHTLSSDPSKIASATVQPYSSADKPDVLIVQPQEMGHVTRQAMLNLAKNTGDARLYQYAITSKPNIVHFLFDHLHNGPAQVSLYFSEFEATDAKPRIFDVQINQTVVLHNFDLLKEAHGQHTGVMKTFTVEIQDGKLDIFSPATQKRDALFNAIRIQAGNQTIAVTSGGESFTDDQGQLWHPYPFAKVLSDDQLAQVRAGTPMVIVSGNMDSAGSIAKQLADAGALTYTGPVEKSRASWMGNWIITRRHAIFDGLPSDEVMKADYQVGVEPCYGLLVDGPNVDVIAAYSRDHDRQIGAAIFTTKLGKGTIVFDTIPGMQPLMRQRLLENEIHFALTGN